MSSSTNFRFRRTPQTDINNPTISHIIKAKPLSKEEGQKFLDDFITNCDNLANNGLTSAASLDVIGSNSNYTGPSTTTVSQLKRLQRELRGLPPLLLGAQGETYSNNNSSNSNSSYRSANGNGTSAAPKNKKIVFDDAVSVPKNKKIVFGDDDEKLEEPLIESRKRKLEDVQEEDESAQAEVEDEADTTVANDEEGEGKSKIDKEERKRLKKERRKAEKEKKAAESK